MHELIAAALSARAGRIALGLGLIGAVILPFTVADFTVFRFTLAIIWSLAILGMVILAGVSGQFSFGHSAFYGMGGYTAAILSNHLGLSVYWALPVAIVVCFVVGFLFGMVAARLGLWYQALATFGLALAFPQFLRWSKVEAVTGGVQGFYLDLQGAPEATGLSADQWWYLLSLSLLVVGMVLARNIIAGRPGRALKAVRDNDLAAAANGIDVPRYRAMAFGISAVYVGVAGYLAAIQLNFVAPGTYSFWLSVQFVIGLVVGGMNSVGGAAIGGLFMQFFPDLVAQLGYRQTTAISGVLLIGAVIAMPTGVAGALARLRHYLLGRR